MPWPKSGAENILNKVGTSKRAIFLIDVENDWDPLKGLSLSSKINGKYNPKIFFCVKF